MDGAWDQLLIALSTTQISPLFKMECYECISYELIQEGEIDMVQQLLEQKVLKGNIENKIKSVLTKVMNGNENQVDWKDIFRYTRNEARTRLTVSLAKQVGRGFCMYMNVQGCSRVLIRCKRCHRHDY